MTLIAALFMRFETPEKADASAHRFKECPKVHFWGNHGNSAYIILKVPDNQRFWSDFIGENPEKSFGGIESELTYVDAIVPDNIEVSYEKIEGTRALCGSTCKTCPTLGTCPGCPALILDTP